MWPAESLPQPGTKQRRWPRHSVTSRKKKKDNHIIDTAFSHILSLSMFSLSPFFTMLSALYFVFYSFYLTTDL